jgi:protein CMS1
MGGDDLEDDYVPDELVAVDDDEGYSEIADNALHLLSDEEGQEDHTPITEQQTEVERVRRKRKRREKEKERKVGSYSVCIECGLFDMVYRK